MVNSLIEMIGREIGEVLAGMSKFFGKVAIWRGLNLFGGSFNLGSGDRGLIDGFGV